MSEKINWRKWRVLLIFTGVITFVMVISGPGCGQQWMLFYDKPIKGYVVDAETGKPIEGTIVVGLWDLAQFFGHGSGGYAKVIVATTDTEGKFKLPFWVTFKPWTFHSGINEDAPEILIYEPGYKVYESNKPMRLGFPDFVSKTAEEKRRLRKEYSINPAKLKRIHTDAERYENYDRWGIVARFPHKHFSKKQAVVIFNALEKEIQQVSDNSKDKQHLLTAIKKMRKFWGGTQ